jgi:O-antigen ligase
VIPRRVRLATALAFGLHGLLILAGRYRFSSDAYTHMLFADHYRTNWWSLWDPRWYTGFLVTSYPPLVHQVIALIGLVLGVDAAYALVLWAVLAAFPLAVYAFSRIFVAQAPAEYAALGAAVMPSIYLAAYAFGQLPTLTATLLALFCAAALAEFLKTGRRLSGALAVMLIATGMAAHHATLLFLPVMVAVVALHLVLNKQVSWQKLLPHLAAFTLPAAVAGLLVIWPFWKWGMDQVMQTPIDHATRHNYITDMFSAFLFFWSVYGPLVAVIPLALRKIVDRRYLAQSTAVGWLVLLGLGGTTPIPRWLFGSGWAWLTYDRFALWASFLLLPFFGEMVVIAKQKLRPMAQRVSGFLLTARIRLWPERIRPALLQFSSRLPQAIIYFVMAGTSALVSFYPTMLPMQPRSIDMLPIVDFLAQGSRSQWRYLTFGFGDQFGYLNRLTTATTIDGSYHTARTLPELRSSGIGSIDASYWLPDGLEKLSSILQIAGKYGVRWGFVDDTKYDADLLQNGWDLVKVLSNGVQVWTNTNAVLAPTSSPPADNPLESFSWGTLPLLALAVTTGLAGLRLRPEFARRALLQLHTLAVGLLPVGLVFWYFHSITNIHYERVYFIYDNALFYISDGLALTAVLAWALARGGYGPARPNEKEHHKLPLSFGRLFQSLTPWLLALCALSSLSVLWSKDWRLTAYFSLHLWLGFGLYLSLRDRPDAWRAAVKGLCAALAIQVIFGFFEFVIQSTGLMASMQMFWPGVLDPATPGASVVQLADGTRWLRAYGTLPHPNILGTFAVALLAGPALLFLTNRKPSVWAAVLFTAGPALLIISFSRAAWLGFIVAALVVLLRFQRFDRWRLLLLGFCALLGAAAAVWPLRGLVFSRVNASPTIPTENFSIIGRAWLNGQAVEVLRQRPLLGTGAGTFVVNLAQHAGIGYIIEPAHNLLLLISSELGITGALILLGAFLILLRSIWIARATYSPQAVVFGAALIGLSVTGLFDHSLWTLAPSRMLLALFLGLWAGQVEHEQS